MVHQLAQLFEPWKTLFGDSKAVSTAVTSMHVVALLFGGGLAVAADRATLRLSGGGDADSIRLAHDLHITHTPVLIAIAALFLSGLALAAADVEAFAVSPIFWVKMGVFAMLLANGAVLKTSSDALGREAGTDSPRIPRLLRRLRRSAVMSVSLWTTTLVLGTALASYA